MAVAGCWGTSSRLRGGSLAKGTWEGFSHPPGTVRSRRLCPAWASGGRTSWPFRIRRCKPRPGSTEQKGCTVSVKFTDKAEKVLLLAGNEARRRSHEYVGTEHLLYAVLTQREGPA